MPYDSDSDDAYDINDPRTRGHKAYKISQEQAARARRRYKYGNDVDAHGENYYPREEDNSDSMEQRLENAKQARYWALDEANRRYEWNGQWTGGAHEGVEEEADKRMRDVEDWNEDIAELERRIDQKNEALARSPQYSDDDDDDSGGSGSGSSQDEDEEDEEDEEYRKNMLDAQSARDQGYDVQDNDEFYNEEEEEQYEDEDEVYDDYDDDD